VRGRERDPAGLGEQHFGPQAVLARERQPQQGGIDVAAGQHGVGSVQGAARPAAAELRDDLLSGLVGGAG